MVQQLIGRLSTRPSSSLTDLESSLNQLAALFLLGTAVALIHNCYDLGLGLPGHHGLELMTALVFARLSSSLPWAAVVVVTGAITGDFALTDKLVHSAQHAPLYLIFGLLVDLVYRCVGEHCARLPIAALLGALVHLSKPLVLTSLAAAAGLEFGFLRHGPVFPLLSYAVFGAVGGAAGALLARARPEHRK